MAAKPVLLFVLAAAVVAASVAFAPMGFRAPSVCVVGEADARAQAYVPAQLAHAYFDAQRVRIGLGTAAVGTWATLGDALAVGERLWLRSTEAASPRFYSVVNNRYFQTNHFVFVPHDTQPVATHALTPTTLAELWPTLAQRYQGNTMLGGYVRFSALHTIAIARPPTRAVPVAGHAQKYYTQPMENFADIWTYLVAVSAPGAKALLPSSDSGMAHVLVLREAPHDLSQAPQPQEVRSLGRVVAHSRIEAGTLAVYSVGGGAHCPQP